MGAEVNILPQNVFSGLKNCPTLHSANAVLTSFSNNNVSPTGVVPLTIKHHGRTITTQFFIVNHQMPPILGLPSCQKLNLLSMIDNVTQTSPQKTTDNFQDVFQGLGCYPKEHHIVIHNTITSKIHPPRHVPFSLQSKLKQKRYYDMFEDPGCGILFPSKFILHHQ